MSEYNEIRRDGATPVKNSGRGTNTNKGDAILDDKWVIDYKESKKTFGLTKDVWAKVRTDATKNGNREPLLKVILGDLTEYRLRLFVVEEDMFLEMKDAWLQLYGKDADEPSTD